LITHRFKEGEVTYKVVVDTKVVGWVEEVDQFNVTTVMQVENLVDGSPLPKRTWCSYFMVNTHATEECHDLIAKWDDQNK
jgi:hypothetical protein